MLCFESLYKLNSVIPKGWTVVTSFRVLFKKAVKSISIQHLFMILNSEIWILYYLFLPVAGCNYPRLLLLWTWPLDGSAVPSQIDSNTLCSPFSLCFECGSNVTCFEACKLRAHVFLDASTNRWQTFHRCSAVKNTGTIWIWVNVNHWPKPHTKRGMF